MSDQEDLKAETKSLLKTEVSAKLSGSLDMNEPHVLSIEELNLSIKQLLEGQFNLVWVRGEVSNFKAHTSGHYYFSLKDQKSQISAVMFRGFGSRLKFKPVDGMEVIVRGRISVYEPRGNYQVLCEMMEPVGAGALQKAFEQLKEKLKSEGLFEAARKKPLPTLPKHLAVVTSPTGAAIRDILNILSRRAPWLEVTVVPTVVQGESAAEKICEALANAQKIPDIDVIILGRGGGSVEDMWCFNDEKLARQIAASQIPVISAVGHEIDFTISDFVADLRAPTPSAAAELVAKSSQELTNRLQQLRKLLDLGLQKHFKAWEQKLQILTKGLVDPQKKLQDLNLRNDDLVNRLQMAMERLFSDRLYELQILEKRLGTPLTIVLERKRKLEFLRQRLDRSAVRHVEIRQSQLQRWFSVLDTLSPLKVVDRGYSIVKKDKDIIKSTSQIRSGDLLNITLAQGSIDARVEKINESIGGASGL
ncbi:MAG: exodeoxyribonuclease VII large subunit [Bdellovibrionaceae bacterium]|nr:exodeoxyribonuclease VII large subunit [Pseudobdellovibrionaceae bacterium]